MVSCVAPVLNRWLQKCAQNYHHGFVFCGGCGILCGCVILCSLRVFNGHLETFLRSRRKTKKVPQLYFRFRREGRVSDNRNSPLMRQALRGARPRIVGPKRESFTITGIAWGWKIKLVLDQKLSRVSTPLFITPLVAGDTLSVVGPLAVTPRCYHTICWPRSEQPSIALAHPLLSTLPPLAHPLVTGLLCMLLITGDALDSTPPPQQHTRC